MALTMDSTRLKAFRDEVSKIFSRTGKADAFHAEEKKDWGKFEKNLGSKRFRKQILRHDQSDEKLKAYTQALGSYKDSKTVLTSLPSRKTPGKKYQIKDLGNGRLGCGCKDWQYRHSVRGTDCEHIQAAREQGFTKGAGAAKLVIDGMKLQRDVIGAKKWDARGKAFQENAKRLRTGGPLIPVGH